MFDLRERELRQVLSRFPLSRFTAAYGSGASRQQGYAAPPLSHEVNPESNSAHPLTHPVSSASQPMIDLLFVTNQTLDWHAENLRRHPQHYSTLARMLGVSAVEYLQRKSAGVYYNTLVPVTANLTSDSSAAHEFLIKYGVISTETLLRDLRDWNTLYVSGRLHKPVQVLHGAQGHDAELDKALQSNLRSAMTAGLLLCEATPSASSSLPFASAQSMMHLLKNRASQQKSPSTVGPALDENDPQYTYPLRRVYESLSSLSYMGDIRLGVAESPNKVVNIVAGNLSGFDQLYAPALMHFASATPMLHKRSQWLEFEPRNLSVTVDGSRAIRRQMWASLPLTVKQYAYQHYESSVLGRTPESNLLNTAESTAFVHDDLQHYCNVAEQQRILRASIGQIVRQSSRGQSVKGIMTAGARKSVRYAFSKVVKRFRG